MSELPTVVLVHGAFSDGVSWSPVALRLLGSGLDVRVPAISNRSLADDAAYVRSFVERIDGPILLVGHSYGATVAAVAGDADNVRGLVLVAGYVLDLGESATDVQRRFPPAEAAKFFEGAEYSAPDGRAWKELTIAVAEFPFLAARGVPSDEAAVLAVTQRPLDAAVLDERASAAAWATRPVWGIVAAQDRVINPDAVRFGLTRAGARAVHEIAAPHLVMHTHPGDVARVIIDAAHSLV